MQKNAMAAGTNERGNKVQRLGNLAAATIGDNEQSEERKEGLSVRLSKAVQRGWVERDSLCKGQNARSA